MGVVNTALRRNRLSFGRRILAFAASDLARTVIRYDTNRILEPLRLDYIETCENERIV